MNPPRAIPSILLLAASLALTSGFAGKAAAQEEPKVAVVDIARTFREYYRTDELNAKIEEAQQASQKQLDERAEDHHRLVEEIARLDKTLGNPALNATARADRQKEREKSIEQIQKIEQETKDFKTTHEHGLQEMIQRGRTQVVEDILVVINARVAARHYDLVLNSSGRVAGSRQVVLYANDRMDITSDILAALNKGHTPSKRPLPAEAPEEEHIAW